jgi:alcohol dehydrogenase
MKKISELTRFEKASFLIKEFKGDSYIFGSGILNEIGRLAVSLGNRAVLIQAVFTGSDQMIEQVCSSLKMAGVNVLGKIRGAEPNAPRDDLFRITGELCNLDPDVIICAGGGSTLDASKAAEVLRTLGGSIDDYFGVGKVTERLVALGKELTPLIAIQTAASSGAHLTKYSNITDIHTAQKKLIIDDAIIPKRAIFDYDITASMPPDFTIDGAFDGMAHALEVLYDSEGKTYHAKAKVVAKEAIGLIVNYVGKALADPSDRQARMALGLATDLGGYAIMLGGTSGAHLNSFSFVDILSHGRACAIMNPYYTVFFAPAIEDSLRLVGTIFSDAGLTTANIDQLAGRDLGIAVAEAMMNLSHQIKFPTTLGEIPGFGDEHIRRAILAAKDPQLRMKLENMPVPLTVDIVEEYMLSILEAAQYGDLSLIKNVV